MTKFTVKAMTGFPMAFYYAALKAMDDRKAAVVTTLERFLTMETEFHRLFTAFDVAYKNSLKSQLTDTIKQKDDERDHIAYVMERVAKLWGEKLDDPVAGHPRQARGAGVQGFRLPHDGGVGG